MEKQPFEYVGTTVYQLEFDSWRKGKEQMRNRVWANVQGYRDTTIEELEATARLFAAAPDLLELVKLANNSLHGTHTYAWQQKAKAVIAKALGENNE